LVNGSPEANVAVYVFSPGTTDQIPIYEDEGVTPITQPILTDSQGRYAFFVDVDTYPEIRLYLEKDGVDFSEANEDLDGVPVPGAGGGGGGAGTFLELTDTPSSYVGRGGDVVLVKTTEDGLETQPWPVSGTVLNYFLSDDAADVGSYYCLYPTETGESASELTSPSLTTGDDQLLWSFVTEEGEPGIDQLALGAYTATLFLKKTGNKDVRVYWKLFKRDTGGTETEILQSAVSDYLATDNSQYLISGYLNEDQALDPTDRLVLKLYANVSGTGTDVTVTLTMEGNYDSRLTINVLSSAFNLGRLSDVTIASPADDEVLAYDSGSGKWINQAPTFLGLTDTPSSYAGYAKYSPMVKDDETGLNWQSFADMELESRTIYVDADNGSDTAGDGSEGSPFQTYEKALSTVRNVIADGVTITIHLKAATNAYTAVDTGRFCIGTGKLVIEGELSLQDSGTATSGTTSSVTDTSKSWTSDQYANKLVKVTISGEEYWRIIDSNSSDTLTLVGLLPESADGADYEIYDWGTTVEPPLTLVQGVIEIRDLYVPSIKPGAKKVSITRCKGHATPDGYAVEILSGIVVIDTYFADINSSSASPAISARHSLGPAQVTVYRTKLLGPAPSWGGVMEFIGPVRAIIKFGNVIDGGGEQKGLYIKAGAFVGLYCDQTGGAYDKHTIRNCGTGIVAESSGGVTQLSTVNINFSGNTTDYLINWTDDSPTNAGAMGWYRSFN